MTTDSLVEIVHETVAPGYGLVRYHGFELIIEMATGYINATKLCAQAGKNRQFFNWIRLQSSKEIIESVASSLHKVRDELTHVIHEGAANEIRGTYVHRDLVPAIAIWASSTYLIKVSRIMEYEATREHRAQLAEKDDAIADLKKLMKEQADAAAARAEAAAVRDKEQTAKIDELLGYAKQTTSELKDANEKMDETNARLEDMQETQEVLEEKVDRLVDTVCKDGAPSPMDKSKKHVLAVFRIDENVHYVIRRQACSYKRTLASFMRNHPDAVLIKEYTPIPNAISTHVRTKEAGFKNLRFRYNYVYGASDDTIKELLNKVYNESRAIAHTIVHS